MAKKKSDKKPKAPDYKPYPKEQDIYRQGEEVPLDQEEDSDHIQEEEDTLAESPEDAPLDDFPPATRQKIETPEDDNWNTENFDTDHTGDDLDVPGGELDDDEEEIGEEDEENNYYSLGGPRKDD